LKDGIPEIDILKEVLHQYMDKNHYSKKEKSSSPKIFPSEG
jgi:hypothetical protein